MMRQKDEKEEKERGREGKRGDERGREASRGIPHELSSFFPIFTVCERHHDQQRLSIKFL